MMLSYSSYNESRIKGGVVDLSDLESWWSIDKKTTLEVLDIFQDVIDEFGIEKYEKPQGAGFFTTNHYPDDSITYCYWMDNMGRNKSLRIKITFKGDKKEMHSEVEKYVKDTLVERYNNMGLNIELGGLSLGDVRDPGRIITLTMRVGRKS